MKKLIEEYPYNELMNGFHMRTLNDIVIEKEFNQQWDAVVDKLKNQNKISELRWRYC